jgi:uncharacterized protein
MQRRNFIQNTTMASAALAFSKYSFAFKSFGDFPEVRVPESQRKFKSKAVENLILEISKNIGNKELAWMFSNCFPNTLDTTVDFNIVDGKPDTYVITGDIDAMWLRDSSAQVWPYLLLCKQDKDLQQLIRGVIHRQASLIVRDPYTNAFLKDETKTSKYKDSDITDMKPGIYERKWEIDSLCYPIRLSYGYWKQTGDLSAFDEEWIDAMKLVVKTFREQQRFWEKGPYHFERKTSRAIDGVPLGGYGYPVKPNGLICSTFRPSDDATIFAYLIPSNFFAVKSLQRLSEILKAKGGFLAEIKDATALSNQVADALKKYSTINHPTGGKIYAYEVNGFGSFNLMDDANVPSLLSMPYLGTAKNSDAIYQATRKYVWSEDNPFFFKGKAAEGIGGPHMGVNMIWPLSIIMKGLTSTNQNEIRACLAKLQKTHAGTGFIHESFHKDDPSKFTRKWFAWANTIFGEFVWKVYRQNRRLLS